MSETVLVYSVPVYVHVNGKDVSRVIVSDEEPAFEMSRSVAMEDGKAASRIRRVVRAHQVAEETDWPAWEFGH